LDISHPGAVVILLPAIPNSYDTISRRDAFPPNRELELLLVCKLLLSFSIFKKEPSDTLRPDFVTVDGGKSN